MEDQSESTSVTTLARDRTILANERTFAAWTRTGLASLAAGLAIGRFMAGVAPAVAVRSIATLLILISMLFFILGMWRHRHLHVTHDLTNVPSLPVWLTVALSTALTAASGIGLAIIWLMR